jgi:hypothetical protein
MRLRLAKLLALLTGVLILVLAVIFAAFQNA